MTRFISFALFLCLSFTASAGNGHRADKFFEKIAIKLELSDEQRVLLSEAHTARKDLVAAKLARKESRNSLEALVESEEYSPAKAQKIADELSEQLADTIVKTSTRMNAFYVSLSDEQREKFAKLKAKKKKRMRHFMNKHHWQDNSSAQPVEQSDHASGEDS